MTDQNQEQVEQMQVHVTYHHAENRGDHAAEVVHAHAYVPDETVADLVRRVMGFPVPTWRQPDPSAFVTLRVVAGTEPKEADDGRPPF
jgi:hypothetical protein